METKETQCEPFLYGCSDKGWWLNGHFYCSDHYKVTVEQVAKVETEQPVKLTDAA